MEIKVFTTGGTIDGLEYSSEEQKPTSNLTFIPNLLESIGVTTPYSIKVLLNKDSRFINDEDREIITKNCIDCDEENVVITHGTITMVETAKYLKLQNIHKTIILTGAMIPADQDNSDAPDNLKLAFEKVETLPQGVYISMSGRIFEADNVIKNPEKGIFEELS